MITVCLATHNGEKYILEQLNSILLQLGEFDEIIISDDNSSDNTLSIINQIIDPRIIIYKNNFCNLIKNFEFLITKASGDIIFLSDQDDIWDSEKVEKHILKHNLSSSSKLVISNISLIDSNGQNINKTFYKKKFSSSLFSNLIKNNFIGCSISFNKEIKKLILPFPENIPMHDWWIGLICCFYNKVIFINENLVYYRLHENNFTKKNKYSFFRKVGFRLFFIKSLLSRIIKNYIS